MQYLIISAGVSILAASVAAYRNSRNKTLHDLINENIAGTNNNTDIKLLFEYISMHTTIKFELADAYKFLDLENAILTNERIAENVKNKIKKDKPARYFLLRIILSGINLNDESYEDLLKTYNKLDKAELIKDNKLAEYLEKLQV